MKYRTIPGTDLESSVLGMGCWATGKMWWGEDANDADSDATIQAALDAGINFFDTAPLYGYGHADEILTASLGSKRHDVIIATKVGIRFKGTTGHAQSDLSAKHIREDTETSLKRLKLDTIPLMQIHWPCELGTPLEESVEALLSLQQEGKIRHIGVCNYNADALADMAQKGSISTLQTPLSMVRSKYSKELKQLCVHGPGGGKSPIGVIAYEPLCRGLLTGKYRSLTTFPDEDVRAQDDWFKGARFLHILGLIRILDKVGKKVRATPGQLAIAWSMRQPGVTTTIVGAKRPEQILENANSVTLLDHPRLWPVLDKIVDDYPPV